MGTSLFPLWWPKLGEACEGRLHCFALEEGPPMGIVGRPSGGSRGSTGLAEATAEVLPCFSNLNSSAIRSS